MLRLKEDAIMVAGESIASPLAGFHLGNHIQNDGMNLQRNLAVLKIDILPTDGITLAVGTKTYTFRDTVTTVDEIKIGNLVTDGNFAVSSGWINYGHWTIAANKATHTPGTPTPTDSFTQTLTQEWFPKPVVGLVYTTIFTVTNRTAGSVKIEIGGVLGTLRNTNATFTQAITALTDGPLQFVPTADFDGEISAVTVTEPSTDLIGLTSQALGDRINLDTRAGSECSAYALGLSNYIALVANSVDLIPTLTVDGVDILKDQDWALVVPESLLENTSYWKIDITSDGASKPTVLSERNPGTPYNYLY